MITSGMIIALGSAAACTHDAGVSVIVFAMTRSV